MKNTSILRYFPISLLFLWSWGFTMPLSYPNIKSLYNEGEFEKIRVSLEGFLKRNASSAQEKDRIFAYKYLGVIYAAEPQGYPVAEAYFYQLLKLAPNAHLSDLYVSSAVEDLFEKTQERLRKENRDISEYDEFGNPRAPGAPGKGLNGLPAKDTLGSLNARHHPDPVPERRNAPRSEKTQEPKILVWPWVAGGLAIAAVGGYLWYASQDKGEKVVTVSGTGN
jgi:hypothetical protein